ncbi:methyl-accepting chemotaxis protein [Pectinatus haikarae]|uniref:Methyl-accepting chemotaxis protein n=1 Tax=Pectinatus haikarae TaxID=349096 RepID=A0ABT9Y9A5_9FIRM|nr:methyl-accepting chemotaxis protein [Pectinatus haikarae]MDQ0204311.1 methyl-accepting chemotaxis protein [Pectinatus haikarae]
MKLWKKIFLGYFAIVIITIIANILGIYLVNGMNSITKYMQSNQLVLFEKTNQAGQNSINESSMLYKFVLTGQDSYLEQYNNIYKENNTLLTYLEQRAISSQGKQLAIDLRTLEDNYKKIVDTRLVPAKRTNNEAEVSSIIKNELEPIDISIQESSDAYRKFRETQLGNSFDQAYTNGEAVIISLIISSLIVTGLGISVGFFITQGIAKPLKSLVEKLEMVADGDFSFKIDEKNLRDNSEIGDIYRAVNTMVKSIGNILRKILNSSETLAASSEELTASTEQSAQASNQVAGAVAGVAQSTDRQLLLTTNANTTVQQISNAINQVASSTETVSSSAEKAASVANSGEDAVKQAISQMNIIEQKTNDTSNVVNELEEKSEQIGQIVDAISKISGQTNLLALNAAIEAARAGEAGRGFAVVAEEIRKLAEESQEAAKQITELVNDVQTKTDSAVTFMNDSKGEVDAGTKIVATAGESFEKILAMVRDMTGRIYEISEAVEAVIGSTQNIVSAVQEIDNESQKNSEQTQSISAAAQEQSASIEEIASSSQHLAKMADDLQQAVRKFKI